MEAAREERIPVHYTFRVPEGQRAERIDVWLARVLPHASRTKVQRAIEAGLVHVNGRIPKASYKVRPGDEIGCVVYRLPPLELVPEPIPLDIVYEDEYLMVINKPAGIPTHPGIGHRRGTLVNAVLYYLGLREPVRVQAELEEEEDEGAIFASEAVRPGIVHRLDKDTSGLLLVTKESALHAELAEQFAQRRIYREYRAIVWGRLSQKHGVIDAPIGRSPKNRKAFAVVPSGKAARTEYWVVEEFPIASLLRLRLYTGRTHQVRVHCTWMGHPLVGDALYGGAAVRVRVEHPIWRQCAERCLQLIRRQALHAQVLGFFHPVTQQWIECQSPLPSDMQAVLDELRAARQATEAPHQGVVPLLAPLSEESPPGGRCR